MTSDCFDLTLLVPLRDVKTAFYLLSWGPKESEMSSTAYTPLNDTDSEDQKQGQGNCKRLCLTYFRIDFTGENSIEQFFPKFNIVSFKVLILNFEFRVKTCCLADMDVDVIVFGWNKIIESTVLHL